MDGSDPLVSMQNDRSSTVHVRDCSASPALQELAAFVGTSRRPVYFVALHENFHLLHVCGHVSVTLLKILQPLSPSPLMNTVV